MKHVLWITISLLIVDHTFCRSGTENEASLATDSQHHDYSDLIYECLDSFLENPTEENLIALEACEASWPKIPESKDENLAYVILLCNKGYYTARFAEIHKSTDAYEKAWKIYSGQQLAGFDIIEYCLKPLGNNYSMLGDYSSAANVIGNYLFIAQKENNTAQIISALINLSIVYQNTGRYEESIALLKNALNVGGIPDFKKGLIYSNLGKNYLDAHNIPEAKRCQMLAIKHFKKGATADDQVHLMNAYKALAWISLTESNIETARLHLGKARKIVDKKPELFKARERARLENDEAALLKQQKRYGEAFENYQRALAVLLPGYKAMSKHNLPEKSLFYAENTIKETFDALADLFVVTGDLHKALECLESSFVVEDLLRKTYHYQEARLAQQAENRNRAEQAISLLYELFTRTKDPKYIARAFQIAERTKATVLREAIEAGLQSEFLSADSPLKKEQTLMFRKAKLENELVLEQMKGEEADVTLINSLLLQQTTLAIDIKELRKEITGKYPHHHVEIDTVNLGKLLKKLKQDNTMLVEYFSGKEFLYVFFVDEHSVSLRRIEGVQKIYDHARMLNGLFADASAINDDIGLYKRIAVQLHEELLIPQKLSADNLLVIPDGILNYIPFEALLYNDSKSTNYSELPYLITKFKIAYNASAAIYTNGTMPGNAMAQNVLAIFPIFKNTDLVLKHSQQEASSIQAYVPGTYFLAEQATKGAFIKNVAQHNIIHLSTHANAGSMVEPPSIAFIDSTVYLPEVYGLRLQPDLMVLSACETGAGKLLKGEGALSLARGFQYAGARNIIFSLWKVNDQSTALLMSSFYQHYADHGSKTGSLAQAKLDYLANENISNIRKSPYYWAAFVYYGNPQDASSPSETRYLILAGLLLGLVVVMIWIKRKYRIIPF